MAVTLSLQERIAVVTIDDGAKNVINHGVLDELEALWTEVEETAGAAVLTGRPGSFCAGYDIKVMTGDDPRAAAELGRRGGRFAHRLFGSPVPTVAVSTGHAFTIGAIWLACCDLRIGETGSFKYGMSEVMLNVPFSPWPLEPLRARLDPRHLTPAILHSRIYDPSGALEAGFIDRLLPAGEGLDAALEAAAQLAELPREAYSKTKLQLRSDALAIMAADLGLDPAS